MMTNKSVIALQVALARTAHHAYLDCKRLHLPTLAAAWKHHAQEHMSAAREEKHDDPHPIFGKPSRQPVVAYFTPAQQRNSRFWDW